MKKLLSIFDTVSNSLKSVPPLLFRLVLAYGFYSPAMMKWADIQSISGWFESMNYPFPVLNAYLAATIELAGVVLLALGLGTRIIAIPLIIVMLVAIFTVHIGNGFDAGDNGYEIPLYYILMLFYLFVNGPGKWSIDGLIKQQITKK